MKVAKRLSKKTWKKYHFIGAMPEWASMRYSEVNKLKENIEWFNLVGWEFLYM